MKTLDEIINNENYKRLNGILVDRTIEIAKKVRQAMDTAELTEVGDFRICVVRSNCGYSDRTLYVVNDESFERRSLEHYESYYFCNDFNCWIEAATGSDRLRFLNSAKRILEEIDTIKEKRINDVENALKAVENL